MPLLQQKIGTSGYSTYVVGLQKQQLLLVMQLDYEECLHRQYGTDFVSTEYEQEGLISLTYWDVNNGF